MLLDLNMPGASGTAVLGQIRARRPELKVLMLSGHLTPEAHAELDRLGQTEFLHKPYTLSELGHRLRKVLDA